MSLLQILESILIMAFIGAIATVMARFIRLPLALMLIISGFIFSLFIVELGIDTGIRAHNFQDLIFFVFLPVLIFEAAYNIDQQQLLKQLIPILLLAVVGLLIATLLTAMSLYMAIGYGFSFITALLTGTLLSATDPVAVVDQLKKLKAPKQLAVLVEGESLFNDATAIVLFSILLAMALHPAESVTVMSALQQFLLVFFGGAISGLLIGLVAIAVSRLLNSFSAVAFISLVTAYGSFYIAEHLLHVSGVMSVLMAGILFGSYQQQQENQLMAKAVEQVWEFLAFVFNTLIFIVMGIVITVEMFTHRWLAMIIAIAAVLLARFISVYSSAILSSLIFNKPIQKSYKPVLVWGGLRGAIAIALVLSLPIELEFWWTIQSMVFGVVLFTLVIQAPTNGLLLRKMKII